MLNFQIQENPLCLVWNATVEVLWGNFGSSKQLDGDIQKFTKFLSSFWVSKIIPRLREASANKSQVHLQVTPVSLTSVLDLQEICFSNRHYRALNFLSFSLEEFWIRVGTVAQQANPLSASAGIPEGHRFPSIIPACGPEKQRRTAQVFGYLPPTWGPRWSSGSWFSPGLALALGAIWGESQRLEDLLCGTVSFK